MIRETDIAQVRERNRIDEVIGDYVALRPSGGGAMKGLCPFHDEKTPSFNVRTSQGMFHCFGCGVGGDVIKFVMSIEHLGFVESVERLAARVGIQLTYTGGGTKVQRDRGTRTRLTEAHRAAQEFYAQQLRTPEAEPAREFLKERGFDQACAERFGCGFAPGGWDQLTRHLLGKGFEASELYQAQLARESKQGKPIDRFRRRLLWPIKELGGDVVGFGARRIFDDDPIEAKYLNTSESPIYKKAQVLFGIDLAKREIARRHQVVVVEGYTDVMAMHAAGVPTAVASSGTAFGNDHMAVLRRLMMDDDTFRGEVIFTFDGDESGQKAALKAFEGDQEFAGQTYIAVAPDDMDPCDLRLRHGDAAVRDLVARRIPLFEFAIRSLLRSYDLDSVDGQVAALQRTVPLVAQIKDAAKRDGYAVKLAFWTGWHDESMVVKRVRETSGGGGGRTRTRQRRSGSDGADDHIPHPDPRDPNLRAQREVLKAALQEPALAGPSYDALPDDAFTHQAYAAVHRAVLEAGASASGLAGPALVEAAVAAAPEGTARTVLSELAVEPLHAKEEVDADYVETELAVLQAALVGRQVAELKSKLQRVSPTEEAEEYRALFGDLVALEQYRKSLREQAVGGMD